MIDLLVILTAFAVPVVVWCRPREDAGARALRRMEPVDTRRWLP